MSLGTRSFRALKRSAMAQPVTISSATAMTNISGTLGAKLAKNLLRETITRATMMKGK